MRLFFAVALPDTVREHLATLMSELESKVPDSPVTWVVPENLHLTLRFLGETDEAALEKVLSAGEEVARAAMAHTIVLEKLGTFGGKASPRVIWVGIREDQGFAALSGIARSLERTARTLGFEAEERPFAAHATIGRVRDKEARTRKHGRPTGGEGRGALARLVELLEKRKDFSAGEVFVERFVLYESRLQGPKPPEYVETASFPLGDKRQPERPS